MPESSPGMDTSLLPEGCHKSRNPWNDHVPKAFVFFVASSPSDCKFFPSRKARSLTVFAHQDTWAGFHREFSTLLGTLSTLNVPAPPGRQVSRASCPHLSPSHPYHVSLDRGAGGVKGADPGLSGEPQSMRPASRKKHTLTDCEAGSNIRTHPSTCFVCYFSFVT